MVGTTLIVDFGDVSEYTNTRGSTYRKGSISLFVEAMSWRIDRAGAWVTGSDDEEPSRAGGVAALVGETVTRVSVLGDTLDVAVRFTSGLVLRTCAPRITSPFRRSARQKHGVSAKALHSSSALARN
jgi:hypothetical protein